MNEEELKNAGNAALFNLTSAMMRKAGAQEWAYAVNALLLAVKTARESPRDSIGMSVMNALKKAGNASADAELEEMLSAHKEVGRALVFPALMLAARYAHETRDDDRSVVLRAIADAMKQIGI